MNKINKLLIISTVCASSYAMTDTELQAERIKWSKAYLAKEYGIEPDGGVKVMPAEQMKSFEENKDMRTKIKADIDKFGYVNEPNDPNNRLFNLAYIARRDLRAHAYDSNPIGTHLRYNINELKMAYQFKGIPENEVHTIGYAPYLTFIKDQGWVGAAQFFTKEDIGNCMYSENNIKLSHAAANIAKEDARDDVNGKVTTVIVSGTEESKFIYTIDWYDDKYFRRIECANDKYDPDVTKAIIELAKISDSKDA